MSLQVTHCAAIGDIPAAAWDALVGADEPFARHAFLHALEASGSVGPGSGWHARHVLVRDGAALVAALPCYEKHDSFGEFIFDWGWADAALRAGLPYYPKLVAAIPFTPASGRRLLVAPGRTAREMVPVMADHLDTAMATHGYSSVHVLFCTADEQALWAQWGYSARQSFQFHWQRAPHWHGFDDFLADLRAPSRKQVRKERARARSHGLTLRMRAADSLSSADVAALFALYRQTVFEKGAHAYLTPAFFAQLCGPLASMTQVATAEHNGQIVAMALYFQAGTSLFGRYWGAAQSWDALHFELCYYLPIEWALAHGITRFEAGAQGEHKLKRGLLPNACFSAHRLVHSGLHDAVARFVAHEARSVQSCMAAYAAHTPFSRHEVDATLDASIAQGRF